MQKKFTFFSVVALFLLILVPQISLANSFTLRSSIKNIEANKTFTVSVYVTPSTSASIYTAQANISFPADLVSVESFNFASAWFPMNQAGYDLIDNTKGKLIKTAGYPSGFNKETLLGTIVFKSKKLGAVSISINKESYILDMDSNNVLKNYGAISINSDTSVIPPVTPITPTPNPTPSPTSPSTLPSLPVVPPVIKNPVIPKVPAPVAPKTVPKVENQTGSNNKEPDSSTAIEKNTLDNKNPISNDIKEVLPLDLPKDIIQNVSDVLDILPKSDETKNENINEDYNKKEEKILTEEEKLKKDKEKEDIFKLVYQDTNKDGISDYDSKYVYNMDPVKDSPVSSYQGVSVTAGEKVLLGFDPNKKELEKVTVEEPVNVEREVTAHSYTVKEVVLTEKKEVLIKGQALPNSYITLYIYSTPMIVTVKTDKNGDWQYILDKELEDGNHTVYTATVNNTGNIVAKSIPFTFVKTAEAVSLKDVLPSEVVEASEIEKPGFLQTNNIFIIIVGIIILAGIILTLIGVFSKKPNQEIVQ